MHGPTEWKFSFFAHSLAKPFSRKLSLEKPFVENMFLEKPLLEKPVFENLFMEPLLLEEDFLVKPIWKTIIGKPFQENRSWKHPSCLFAFLCLFLQQDC